MDMSSVPDVTKPTLNVDQHSLKTENHEDPHSLKTENNKENKNNLKLYCKTSNLKMFCAYNENILSKREGFLEIIDQLVKLAVFTE